MKVNRQYKTLSELGFDKNISDLIDAMLSPTVDERIASYDDLLADIERIRKAEPKLAQNSTAELDFDCGETMLPGDIAVVTDQTIIDNKSIVKEAIHDDKTIIEERIHDDKLA